MFGPQPHSVQWFHLDTTEDDVWEKLLDFFKGEYWNTFQGILQVGRYDTSTGVVWTKASGPSIDSALEQIAEACAHKQRFSVTCRSGNKVHTFLPPTYEGSSVVHPLWHVLVACNGGPEVGTTDSLTERLLQTGFVLPNQ